MLSTESSTTTHTHSVQVHTQRQQRELYAQAGSAMASAGVVGQNQGPPPQARLDSDPQLLLFKFVNVRKKTPRKTSLEKMMMFRKCSVPGGEVGSAPAPTPTQTPDQGGRASVHHHHHHHPGSTSVPVAGDAAGLPGEGRAADAPRSADGGHGDSSSSSSGGGGGPGSVMMKTTAPVPGSRDSQRGPAANDRHRKNTCDRDSNQNTRGQRRHAHGKAREVLNVPPAGASTAHVGPKGARSSPSALHGAPADAEAGGGARLPLERLTQGRTGVVRLARAEPTRRRKAWSIFPPDGRVGAGHGGDPRVKAERGEGRGPARVDANQVGRLTARLEDLRRLVAADEARERRGRGREVIARRAGAASVCAKFDALDAELDALTARMRPPRAP